MTTKTTTSSSTTTVKTLQQNIRNLLTKIKSTSSFLQKETSQRQPVDEASILLGNQVATEFLSLHLNSKSEKENREWKDIGDDCLQTLIHCSSESVSYGFFIQLSKQLRVAWSDIDEECKEEVLHWWAQSIWICDRELKEPQLSDGVLLHCLTSYLQFACKSFENSATGTGDTNEARDPFFLASIYPKCNPKTRRFFFREAISMALRPKDGVNHGWAFLSPLLHHIVLRCSMTSDNSREEAHTFLAFFFQELRFLCMTQRLSPTISFMKWLVNTTAKWFSNLVLQYDANNAASQYELSLCVDMDTNLVEMCIILTGKTNFSSQLPETIDELSSNVIELTCQRMIPMTCRHHMSFLSRQLMKALCALNSIRSLSLSESTIVRLAICSLTINHEYDVLMLLNILLSSMKNHTNHISAIVLHALFVIGNIYQHLIGDSMMKLTNEKLLSTDKDDDIYINRDPTISAFRNADRWGTIINSMSSTGRKALLKALPSNDMPKESAPMNEFAQCEALLLTLSTLHMNSSSNMEDALFALRILLSKYPALGRRSLSICHQILQSSIDNKRVSDAISILGFLCDTVTSDPVCASSIWSLLSSLSENHVPVKVKCMVIRFYPSLCKSNKRLYGRVITQLGNMVEHPNAMIRTTTSITIHDLAKMDIVRDVSDVIGWIQKFLTDEEPLVVMHSVLSLHYLIIHDYLDFSMVIKVLKKKMIDIDDVLKLTELPLTVLEALIELLGDGHLDSSDENSIDDRKLNDSKVVITVHVQSAILGLEEISRYIIQKISSTAVDDVEGSSLYFLLAKTLKSLAKYTFPMIGIDYDMVRLNIEGEASKPYRDLLSIMMAAFEVFSKSSRENLYHKASVIMITKKMCAFEEYTLGPATWITLSSLRKEKSAFPDVISDINHAREGTLINFLVQKLRDQSISPQCISLALNCLEDLSLPSNFISFLRHCLFNNILNGCQQSAIGIVISQLKIQRRAAHERRDFLKFALEIIHRSTQSFWNELGVIAGSEFIDGIPVIFSNVATDAVKETLPILYDHVMTCPNSGVIINFIVALYKVIYQSKSSPASVTSIESFLEQHKSNLYTLPNENILEIQLYLQQDENSKFDILLSEKLMKFSS